MQKEYILNEQRRKDHVMKMHDQFRKNGHFQVG